jgi:hypothetical protein
MGSPETTPRCRASSSQRPQAHYADKTTPLKASILKGMCDTARCQGMAALRCLCPFAVDKGDGESSGNVGAVAAHFQSIVKIAFFPKSRVTTVRCDGPSNPS